VHHLSKVKAPVLMLLGAVDLRVPPSNGGEWSVTRYVQGAGCMIQGAESGTHALERDDAALVTQPNIPSCLDCLKPFKCQTLLALSSKP
jgi:hypothetical protein